MIKANELRIGNMIYLELGLPGLNLHTIKGQDISDIENGRITLNTIQPIPLTPEWLEQCGFTIPDEHGYMMRVNKGVIRIKIDDRLKFPSVKIGDLHCAVTPFVHQLQNLYFALTGEELTINNVNLQTTS